MTKLGAWAEIYRPKTIEDTILPERIKNRFRTFVEEGSFPNLILAGPAGVGKTTIAKAALDELGADTLFINGSMDGGKDTFRYKISSFASSVSFTGGRKYVIIDEADDMPNGAQMGFRSFQETFDRNCGFIFTCNYPNRIMPEIHSRFGMIDFSLYPEEKPAMAAQFMKRAEHILEQEGVEYEKRVLAEVIKIYFPDFRKVLTELQSYVSSGGRKIDVGILSRTKVDVADLFGKMKVKDYEGVRAWVADNTDQDANSIFRSIYDNFSDFIEKRSWPSVVVYLGEYQHKHALVADPEINLMALMTEIMFEVDFK